MIGGLPSLNCCHSFAMISVGVPLFFRFQVAMSHWIGFLVNAFRSFFFRGMVDSVAGSHGLLCQPHMISRRE
jgi:hypothetical protein